MMAVWHTMRDHATLHPLTSYATPPYQDPWGVGHYTSVPP